MTRQIRPAPPPRGFRRSSVTIAAVVVAAMVAVGVGTASAGVKRNGQGNGKQAGTNAGFNGNRGQFNNPGQFNRGRNPGFGQQPPGNRNGGGQKNGNGNGQGNNGQGNGNQGNGNGQGNGNNGQGNGPAPQDFIQIQQVQPGRGAPQAAGGSFTTRCGTNENGHFDSSNFIVSPGVTNGAHHLHDYVGNLSTNEFSNDQNLAAAGTTCQNQDDKSAYFWPVLRDTTGGADGLRRGEDPADLNTGRVLRPQQAKIEFRGNAVSKVTAMPRFLRILTGDAKSFTNGPANARAQWTCAGFNNRITTDKYPLCPNGQGVTRISDFPSCWDGENTDSANHRTHVVFPDNRGACPQGTVAIPQLRITLVYNVPPGTSFALDSFPEQLHKPITDHNDFVNVMSEQLMQQVVNCINSGQRC